MSKKKRVVEPGEFKVMIGASYEDIRLTGSFFYRSSSLSESKETVRGKMINDSNFKEENIY